jgi:hypothetical protein
MSDSDGDVVFSSFDTRDLDKAQPKMDCGTHLITGGTGKYKGITGTEPFACVTVDTPAGEPAGSFAIDIPTTRYGRSNNKNLDVSNPGADTRPLNESPAKQPGFLFLLMSSARSTVMKHSSSPANHRGTMETSMSVSGTERKLSASARVSANRD